MSCGADGECIPRDPLSLGSLAGAIGGAVHQASTSLGIVPRLGTTSVRSAAGTNDGRTTTLSMKLKAPSLYLSLSFSPSPKKQRAVSSCQSNSPEINSCAAVVRDMPLLPASGVSIRKRQIDSSHRVLSSRRELRMGQGCLFCFAPHVCRHGPFMRHGR